MKKIFFGLIFWIMISTFKSDDYGTTGNSQIGTGGVGGVGGAGTPAVFRCTESDNLEKCVTKQTCCHITNEKNGYSYTGCIDVIDKRNFSTFCTNFYKLNRDKGYQATECKCMGYTHIEV
jgi:hypothetical protein